MRAPRGRGRTGAGCGARSGGWWPGGGRAWQCGTYVRTVCGESWTRGSRGIFEIEKWGLEETLEPDYNVAPTKEVYAVLDRPLRHAVYPAPVRQLRKLKWGLVPSWAKTPEGAARMINARAETVHEKPSYRRAFATRRCILPADGYYEWVTGKQERGGRGPPGGLEQPDFVTPADGSVFAMAGLSRPASHPRGIPHRRVPGGRRGLCLQGDRGHHGDHPSWTEDQARTVGAANCADTCPGRTTPATAGLVPAVLESRTEAERLGVMSCGEPARDGLQRDPRSSLRVPTREMLRHGVHEVRDALLRSARRAWRSTVWSRP
ncbi:hypothetical protein SFUMM280S_08219 [Streptomyces fumanus]